MAHLVLTIGGSPFPVKPTREQNWGLAFEVPIPSFLLFGLVESDDLL